MGWRPSLLIADGGCSSDSMFSCHVAHEKEFLKTWSGSSGLHSKFDVYTSCLKQFGLWNLIYLWTQIRLKYVKGV